MEKLNQLYITSANIKRIEDLMDFELKFRANIIKNLGYSSYCLVVKLETKRFIRITLYPIVKSKVLKVSFKGNNFKIQEIEKLSKEIRKFEVIHSTGLVMIEENLVFEFYLNLNFEDDDYKDLITLIEKHKNKFKDIKLEEIALDLNE